MPIRLTANPGDPHDVITEWLLRVRLFFSDYSKHMSSVISMVAGSIFAVAWLLFINKFVSVQVLWSSWEYKALLNGQEWGPCVLSSFALFLLNLYPRRQLLDNSEPREAGKARIAFLVAIAIHAGAIAWAGALYTSKSSYGITCMAYTFLCLLFLTFLHD